MVDLVVQNSTHTIVSRKVQLSLPSSIDIEGSGLAPDAYLELFIFDSTMLLDAHGNPGTISYFTNTGREANLKPIVWRGNTYYPMPLQLTGADVRADGTAMSRPQLAVSNVNRFLLAAILTLGDLIGMRVTRFRTFERFLDNGVDPNVNMHYPLDYWIVTKKLVHTNKAIAFELSNQLDVPGVKLPKKLILRDEGFPGVGRTRAR